MRETEVKGVVPDEEACVRRLEGAGALRVFEGRIEDRRYDTPDRSLLRADRVLRLRTWRDAAGARSSLDWKEPVLVAEGLKHREETVVDVGDADAMATILVHLGYEVSREIDRDVRVFDLEGAVVRFERFARMDTLVEVEGAAEAIDRAVRVVGLPRASLTPERLAAYVLRFEARTGRRAAICDREAQGDYRYALEDA